MSYEDFEEEYFKNRPAEPYCENEQPDLWAQIVAYAESNLKRAYEAGQDEALKKNSMENCQLPDNQQLMKTMDEKIKKEEIKKIAGLYEQRCCWYEIELGSICIRFCDD